MPTKPARAVKTAEQVINIKPLERRTVRLRIIGTTPQIQHRVASKAKQSLLLGGGRKTKAERAGIKHDPLLEFREAAHVLSDPKATTLLGVPSIAIKAALCDAALETEGVTKTAVQRLLYVAGEMIPVYGRPELLMSVTRNSDINRTPDIRTRPILRQWGFEVEVSTIVPQLEIGDVFTLACNAGQVIGIGDYRQAKGKGNFGLFRVIHADTQDDEWDELVKNHGRAAQVAAMDDPAPYDAESAEMLEWFHQEFKRRAA